MKRLGIDVVLAFVFFTAGWFGYRATHAAPSQENTDQIAAVVMTTRLQAPDRYDNMVGSAYELRVAQQICITRQHLSPQVPELHDPQECAYRLVRWSTWWNQMARNYSKDAMSSGMPQTLQDHSAEALAYSWGLKPRKPKASPSR